MFWAIALIVALGAGGVLTMIVASFLLEPPAVLSSGSHWAERMFSFGLILFAIALAICEYVAITALILGR